MYRDTELVEEPRDSLARRFPTSDPKVSPGFVSIQAGVCSFVSFHDGVMLQIESCDPSGSNSVASLKLRPGFRNLYY